MYEVLGKFTKNRDLKSCGDRKTTENTLECAQVEKENIKAYMDSQIEHVGTLSQYKCRLWCKIVLVDRQEIWVFQQQALQQTQWS